MLNLRTVEIQTLKDLAARLNATERQIRYLAYSAPYDVKYRRFTVPKKSGGKRIIEAPKASLRYIQRKLLAFLSQYYIPPSCVFGFVEGRSNSMNAKAHMQGSSTKRITNKNRRIRYLVTCDIENFFGSIDSRRIYGLLSRRPFPFSNEVAYCISKLCTTTLGLPQGAPTSPLLSNMIFRGIDKKLMGYAKRHGMMYTRYADDLTFSVQNAHTYRDLFYHEGEFSLPKELVKIIETHGNEESFRINPKKTRFAGKDNCQIITGIVINEKPNLKRSYYRELRACLYSSYFCLNPVSNVAMFLGPVCHNPVIACVKFALKKFRRPITGPEKGFLLLRFTSSLPYFRISLSMEWSEFHLCLRRSEMTEKSSATVPKPSETLLGRA